MTIQHKVFAAYSVLTAADVNNYLMNQDVVQVTDESELTSLPTSVKVAFATATGALAVYDAGAWIFYDSRWQTYNMTVSVAAAAPYTELTYGNAFRVGRYRRQGRQVELNGMFQIGSTTSYGGANSTVRIGYPSGLLPITAYYPGVGVSQIEGVALVAHASGTATGLVLHEYNGTQSNRRMTFIYPTNAAALAGGGSGTWNMSNVNNYVQFSTSYEVV